MEKTNKTKSPPNSPKNLRRDCSQSGTSSTSNTHFYKKPRHKTSHHKITRDEYSGISEPISGSTASFGCVHGPEGKQYSKKGRTQRFFLKELDPIRCGNVS